MSLFTASSGARAAAGLMRNIIESFPSVSELLHNLIFDLSRRIVPGFNIKHIPRVNLLGLDTKLMLIDTVNEVMV